MAKRNENQSLREYGNRKKRYRRIRNLIIIVLLLAAAIAGVVFYIYITNKSYQDYKVINSTEIAGDKAIGYLSHGSSVVKYGKDGAQAYDKEGKALWNSSYEMSDPVTDVCEDYVTIADRGGKSVYIFNKKGAVGNFETEFVITEVEVGRQGVVAVMMSKGESNYFKLYDTSGTVLVEGDNTVNNAGYPLDMTLSNDAKKLVVVYMSITSGEVISKVTCYNFSEVGKNEKNQVVGVFASNKGIIVPKVEFLNNDTFCAFKDNGFALFTMKEIPKLNKEIKIEGSIKSVLYNKNYAGIVLEDADGSSRHLKLYDLQGKLALEKAIKLDYSRIFLTDEEILIYDNMSCIVMKMNGKVKFSYTFENSMLELYPINHLDRYFLINEKTISEIGLME